MADLPRLRTAAVLAALALLPRCACDTVPDDAVESCEASQVVPGAVRTDILFVVDDSGSMSEEQATLQAGLGAFIQTLASSPVANDFQIGVTTSSVADFDGTARAPAGTLVAPGVMTASDPNLVTTFQAAVAVGTAGSGREQPFEAARLAISKSAAGGPNEGFLRPGARLAVIFLSDEDDCSGAAGLGVDNNADCRAEKVASPSALTEIGDVVSDLSAGREVVVAAIVGVAPGTLAPSCGQSYCSDQACGTALDKGDRFVALLNAVGPSRSRLASICDADFDQALSEFAGAILSQTLPLEGAPADWRMLVARVERPGTGVLPCEIAPWDAPAGTRAGADAIYEPPQPGRPATLTFQNACALEQGDRVDVQVVCIN
jgi:hypothetical protein